MLAFAATAIPRGAVAASSPDWLRELSSRPLPTYDADTDAVQLLAETTLTVRADGRIRRVERRAFRVLRPGGERYGLVRVDYDDARKVVDLHGWCIPSSGKDYAVKLRDAIDSSLPGVANGELVSDVRSKLLQIPAATPGAVVGYEYELEEPSDELNDEWGFQDVIPVREARYVLQLPTGWSQRVAWLGRESLAPATQEISRATEYRWTVQDVPPVKVESAMPPWRSVAASMVVTLVPPAGRAPGWGSWQELGAWYDGLFRTRREPSPAIREKVAALTATERSTVDKMSALARFVQNDIRYVAIELGIGGHQPHAAADVFANRYGDCKDKATLLASMLQVVGIESFPLIVNTERGNVSPATPALRVFDHAILAIRLPPGVDDPDLLSVANDAKLGRLLFFDPTDTQLPFGRLSGSLQANYGLLVHDGTGDLIALPKLAPETNGRRRSAALSLDEQGTLRGDFVDVFVGDAASIERYRLRALPLSSDRVKPIERLVASSIPDYRIVKAALGNADIPSVPFERHYTLEAERYAKSSAGMLFVRPRVLGSLTSDLLETREARRHSIEFDGPALHSDEIEIAVPAGYVVEGLPAPVNVDTGFATYRSHTEFTGGKLRYSRTFEIRGLSVPAARADELKALYRTIAADERRSVALRKR